MIINIGSNFNFVIANNVNGIVVTVANTSTLVSGTTNTYRGSITISGTCEGSERITIIPKDNSVYDALENQFGGEDVFIISWQVIYWNSWTRLKSSYR